MSYLSKSVSASAQRSRIGHFILPPSFSSELEGGGGREDEESGLVANARQHAFRYWEQKCRCRFPEEKGVASLRACISTSPQEIRAHVESLLNPGRRIVGLLAPLYWEPLSPSPPATDLLQRVGYALSWTEFLPTNIALYHPSSGRRIMDECKIFIGRLVARAFGENPDIQLDELFGSKRHPFVSRVEIRCRSLSDIGLLRNVRMRVVNDRYFILRTACSAIAADKEEVGALGRLAGLYAIGNVPIGLDAAGRLMVLVAEGR